MSRYQQEVQDDLRTWVSHANEPYWDTCLERALPAHERLARWMRQRDSLQNGERKEYLPCQLVDLRGLLFTIHIRDSS